MFIVNGDLEEEPDQLENHLPLLLLKDCQKTGAIKYRFGGNERIQEDAEKVLKNQFERLSLHQMKVWTRLMIVCLPPSWNQIALIMRNKLDIDEIDIDDLYNNLREYEDEKKRSSSSTSTSQNMSFLSFENTTSTNEVSTASRDLGRQGKMDFKEKRPVSLDKSKIECYNCHRKGHFARECGSGRNQGKRSYGDNGRSNAPTNESSSHALMA
ncbi:ribonuclease H-like domain-containing protein [Tanacetum coccineum]